MQKDPIRPEVGSGKAEPQPALEPISSPNMPAAWAGDPDKSRLLTWGDFFLIFAVDAPQVTAVFDPRSVKNPHIVKNPPIKYPYSLTAFYHRDRKPHGHPSHRPVLSVTIEQLTINIIAAMGGSSSESYVPPPMLCQFHGSAHLNFGRYEGSLDPEAAYAVLVERARSALGVTGDPTHIERPGAAKSGCLVFLACLSGLGGAAVESLRVLAQ
jgi:hypothetical protein